MSFIGASEGRMADLYRTHVAETRRLAFLLTGDLEIAKDLTQEAFIRSFGRLAHLRNEASFRPYLRKTLVNLAKMRYRRDAVERRHLTSLGAEPHALDLHEEDDATRHALTDLPYRQRAALVMRFYLDLSDDETAEILGCATGTVRSLISRGLASLREVLGDVSDG